MAWRENVSFGLTRCRRLFLGTSNGGEGVEVTATAAELNILDGTTVTAAELNILDGALATATFTVGTETTNVINVAIQLKDANGVDMTAISSIGMYLSSDAAGVAIEASGPDSWVIGTDGILLPDGSDSLISGVLISEADGDIDINLTHVGADTFYMNVIMPNGSISTSAVITFDSDT